MKCKRAQIQPPTISLPTSNGDVHFNSTQLSHSLMHSFVLISFLSFAQVLTTLALAI